MDVTLAALGQSKRLELLKILIETETGYGVTYLSSVLSVKPPTVEKHLSILKNLGLVKRQVTIDFARERWVVRGKNRVRRIVSVLDGEVHNLVEVGRLFEEAEKLARKLQYLKEQASDHDGLRDQRKEGESMDRLLKILREEHIEYLDDDEKNKINYWSTARSVGLL